MDVADQVTSTALPPGEGELRRYIGDLLAQPVTAPQVPWRLQLLAGYDRNEFALLLFVHHALFDGASAMALLRELLEPGPRRAPSVGTHAMARPVGSAGSLLRTELVPASLLPWNRLIDRDRRVRWVVVPRELVEATRAGAAPQARPTVNDVYLAAVAGAMRGVLAERGNRLPRRVFAFVGVNMRPPDAAVSLGNDSFGFRVPLPLDLDSPAARLARVRSATVRAKADGQAGPAAMRAAERIGWLLAAYAWVGLHPRRVNIGCTNVLGPTNPWTLADRPAISVFGLANLPARHGLVVALTSYQGNFTVSVVSDGAHETLAERFTAALAQEFSALAN